MFELSSEDIQRYEQGVSVQKLAKEHGVDDGVVRRCLLRHAVHVRTRSEANSVPRPFAKRKKHTTRTRLTIPEEYVEKYLAGMSAIALAKVFSVHPNTIGNALRYQGIPVRDKKTQGIARSAAMQGIPLSEWKEHRSSYIKRITMSAEWKHWRTQIFERDNYTCLWCGIRGYKLHPHHIRMKSKYPERTFDVTNGVTLCTSCHLDIGGYEEQVADIFEKHIQLHYPTYRENSS